MDRARITAKWRTSKTGGIRFNRDFMRIGVGRITRSSRATNPKEFRRRDELLTKLANSAQIDVLRAFRNGRLTIEQLVDADREQRLKSADLLGMLSLRQPLGARSQTRCRGWEQASRPESATKYRLMPRGGKPGRTSANGRRLRAAPPLESCPCKGKRGCAAS